jgi:RNA-dependent RNA polymerase
MQEKEVNDARKMLQEDIDQVYRKVKEKGIITDYRTLTQGIQDQFFFYQKTLRIMQLKARIPVKKSALLMGVMDEYRTLGPKEVYIRISKDGKSTVVEGPVVVAKNPCLHPGDIRLLTAVNYPQIAHLVNVVVFSQLGERPAPHMCSGSDLDGDEYFVTWKSKLTNIREEYPLDYVSEDGRQYEALNVEKVKDYFVDYMRYDSLGKIANLHALFADLHGIMASDALYYAEKHAKAVDYPKTGIKIFESSSVSEWPDFLERGYLPSYKSPGILGKLYRNLNGFIERTEGFSYRTLDM